MSQPIIGRVCSAFYKSSRGKMPKIYMAIRTLDGKKVFPEKPIISPIRPYFYFDKKDGEAIRAELEFKGLKEGADFDFAETDLEFGLREGEPMRCDMWEPWRVGGLKRHFRKMGIEISEADIPYIRRLRIDMGIKAGVILRRGKMYPYGGEIPKPKLIFIDCEIDDSRGYPEKAGEYSILSVSTVDEGGNIRYFTWEYGKSSESRMLQELFDYLMDYDYIVVWNKDFEAEQIPARCRNLNLWLEWRIFRWVDLAEFHRMFYQKTYYEKLNFAYEKCLKKYEPKLKRIGVRIRDRRIRRLPAYYKAWKNDPELLKDVNISHSYALYVMEKAMELIRLYSDVADEAGIFVDYAVWNSHIVDTFAMRFLAEGGKRWIIPSSGIYDKKKSFKGAIVFPVKRGIHSFIFTFDFQSLYNRIIQAYLLDPICYYKWGGTFTENGIEEYMEFAKTFGEFYGEGGLPTFPAILRRLEGRRNDLKEEMGKYKHGSAEYDEFYHKQYSVKVILLAHYGVLSMSSSRWKVEKEIPTEMVLHISEDKIGDAETDVRVPNEPKEKFNAMITFKAREALTETREFFEEEEDIEIIMGDTDSCVVKPLNLIDPRKTYRDLTREDMDKLLNFGEKYAKILEKYYEGKFEKGIEIKLEKIADRGLFGKVRKQRYCRVIFDEGGWQKDRDGNLSWYPYIKGLPLVRSDRTAFLRKFQKETLKIIVEDPERIYPMWSKIIGDYYKNKYDHMLILRIGIHQPLDQYEKETPVIQAARKRAARGENIRIGEKVAYVVVDVSKKGKVAEPIDDSLPPEEAIKKVPKLTKKALDFYWDNRIWKNIAPFLELVLSPREVQRIALIRERKMSLDEFM